MVSKRFSFLAGCVVLVGTATDVFARARDAVPSLLALSVFNDASIPARVLAEAESRAGRILSQAGIQVEWLNCEPGGSPVPDQFAKPSPCSSIAYPAHLSLRVVLSGQAIRDDIFGEAYANSEGQGAYINLYYAHVVKSNAHTFLGEGELLGYIMAHEVGHLLLGTGSHGNEGIMQGHWEEVQLSDAGKGKLWFTPLQAASMRECLAMGARKKEQRRSIADEFASGTQPSGVRGPLKWEMLSSIMRQQ